MVEHHFPNVVVSDCLTYSLPSVAAGCWIGIDDLEFRSEDDLSGDEVAQVLFILTGGAFDCEGAFGQCKGHQVIYVPAHPAQLVLKPIHPVGCLGQPALYYLT